jgi:hypothetical protein
MNDRAIISFGEKNSDFLVGKFDKLLWLPMKVGIKKAHINGIFYGYS